MFYLAAILLSLVLLLLWAERGRFLQKSTLASWSEHGLQNITKFLHMYVYARWPDKYLHAVRILLPGAAKKNSAGLADGYHAKILTPDLARKIIKINKSIPVQDLEQVIPYPAARKIVLDHPLDIAVLECPCRASSPHPCSPSMVCMIIGRPFTDFILEHHPHKSKRLTGEEALALLEEVHQKGCVHSAFFKEACLDRFYVICNCCKCCCLGLEAMVKHGVPIMAPSGFAARINEELCIGCGACMAKCPFEAVTGSYEIMKEKCMGCGVCLTACTRKAIVLERDETKGIPLDVSLL
ncbi:MAG: ATP-binding protein [Peptococcaceae bacterium]